MYEGRDKTPEGAREGERWDTLNDNDLPLSGPHGRQPTTPKCVRRRTSSPNLNLNVARGGHDSKGVNAGHQQNSRQDAVASQQNAPIYHSQFRVSPTVRGRRRAARNAQKVGIGSSSSVSFFWVAVTEEYCPTPASVEELPYGFKDPKRRIR